MSDDGYICLTDFGCAAQVLDETLLTMKIGSLHYQAPEMLSGEGYSFAYDWWALGILCYEMIFYKRPFTDYQRRIDLQLK